MNTITNSKWNENIFMIIQVGRPNKNSDIKQRQIKWITIKECAIKSKIAYIKYRKNSQKEEAEHERWSNE